jgi:raffinose/stachyose/melibiose transport system permease protein
MLFRYSRATALREGLVWIAALLSLLPFYFLIITAFKPDEELLTTGTSSLPNRPTVENFTEVLTGGGDSNILLALMHSTIITLGSIAGLVAFGSLAAYVLARTTERWGTITFYLFLTAIVLPTQLGLIPLYVGARNLGLVGSMWGMIILYVGSLMPLAVFLYAGFFRGLPREYEEAAAIDGAGPGRVFLQVVLPLMAPATGTVAILTGLIVWNDFFSALIFLGGSDTQTLTVSMYYYVGSLVSAWNKIFSIVIISMVPILAFYLFAQKRFIQGFAGGIK